MPSEHIDFDVSPKLTSPKPAWSRPESYWQPSHLVESAWIGHAPFAFWITAALKPRLLVELGTHNGYSYFAFCEAVSRLGLPTRCFALDTWKGDDHAGYYDESVFEMVQSVSHEKYHRFSALLRGYFDDHVSHFADGSIDLLHIDGRHGYEDVKHDFETWLPKLSQFGVVLFHDIGVHERDFGVWKLWDEVSHSYPSFSFEHSNGLGVLITGDSAPLSVLSLTSANAEEAEKIRQFYSDLGAVTDSARARDVELDQLRAVVAALEIRAVSSEREAAHMAQAAASLQVTVDQLVSSVAWRSTKPLRVLFGMVPDSIRVKLHRAARHPTR